jgi:hypothetical protein
MWLRVMPQFSPGKTFLVTDLRQALFNGGDMVRALNGEEQLNPRGIRGADGYGSGFVGGGEYEDQYALMLVYAFTSGEIWSLDTTLLQASTTRIFFDPQSYVSALIQFSAALKRLGVSGPYRWIAGIDGMKGRHLSPTGSKRLQVSPACLAEQVIVEGLYSGNAQEAASAIEPFVARVFDAGHLSR